MKSEKNLVNGISSGMNVRCHRNCEGPEVVYCLSCFRIQGS